MVLSPISANNERKGLNMLNTHMSIAEIITQISDEIEYSRQKLEQFEEAFNDCFFGSDEPSGEDLYNFTASLNTGGGGHDEIAYSLYRIAAKTGHKKAIVRLKDELGDELFDD